MKKLTMTQRKGRDGSPGNYYCEYYIVNQADNKKSKKHKVSLGTTDEKKASENWERLKANYYENQKKNNETLLRKRVKMNTAYEKYLKDRKKVFSLPVFSLKVHIKHFL